MNRFALCGVLLGLGSFGLAQDLTKKITVDIPAARASVALAELGKAAGLRMEPAGNLRDDVFVIRAQDATIDEIMQRVAQAESGKWIQQSGIYILTRENSTSVAQERAEIKARADLIAKAIARLNEGVVKQPDFDQAAAQKLADETKATLERVSQSGFNGRINVGATGEKTPTARAIARILGSIDPSKLAQIGMNQRVVFSTDPTSVQLSLGGPGVTAFRQFVAEQQLYTQAYNAGQPQDGNNRMIMVNGLGNPTMGNGDPKLGLGLGLVVVQRRFGTGLNIEILAADPKLDTISSGTYVLQLPQPQPAPAEAANEQPLKISDEAKEMAKALEGNGGPGAGGGAVAFRAVSLAGGGGGEISMVGGPGSSATPKLSADLRAKVLNPEKFDPMSFVPGEAMLALSRSKNKNIVALLPDYAFGSLTRQFGQDVTASALLASLAPTHSLVSTQDENWIVVSPGLPYTGRHNTVNRSALGMLLRTMDKSGFLRLDDVVTFAAAQTKIPGMSDFDILYPRLINASATDTNLMPLATGSHSLYKFYGSLSNGQRQSIASGNQTPFMNLSQQQLALVADMLYNSQQGPTVQQENQNPAQVPGSFSVTMTAQGNGRPMPMVFGGPLSAKTERTIVVPNGIVNDGFMIGTINTQDIVQAINSQTGATSFLDANSLAFTKNASTNAELAAFSASSQFDKYRMARQTTFSVRFMFNPRVTMARSLNDTSANPDSQAGPYESLPEEFRKRVELAAQRIKEAMDRVPSRGQNAPPPQK